MQLDQTPGDVSSPESSGFKLALDQCKGLLQKNTPYETVLTQTGIVGAIAAKLASGQTTIAELSDLIDGADLGLQNATFGHFVLGRSLMTLQREQLDTLASQSNESRDFIQRVLSLRSPRMGFAANGNGAKHE